METDGLSGGNMKKPITLFLKVILTFFSGVFYVLSLPPVRNAIWGKMVKKGEEKVVDAKARVIKGEKKKLFR